MCLKLFCSTLKLVLSCPLPPEGPSFLLYFSVCLFHPVIPSPKAQGCAGHAPFGVEDDQLHLASSMTGCCSFSSLLRACSCLPWPAAAWGSGDWRMCLRWGSPACVCSTRMQGGILPEGRL